MTPQLNPTSRDWKIVEEWAQKMLAADQTALESLHTDPDKTQRLRGSLARTRALLALAIPPTPRSQPNANDPLGQEE